VVVPSMKRCRGVVGVPPTDVRRRPWTERELRVSLARHWLPRLTRSSSKQS
jgi:hypothetical protein